MINKKIILTSLVLVVFVSSGVLAISLSDIGQAIVGVASSIVQDVQNLLGVSSETTTTTLLSCPTACDAFSQYSKACSFNKCIYNFVDKSSQYYCPSSQKCFVPMGSADCGSSKEECEQRCTFKGCIEPSKCGNGVLDSGELCDTNFLSDCYAKTRVICKSCNSDPRVCHSSCGSSSECSNKDIGASCGTNKLCDGNCQCVEKEPCRGTCGLTNPGHECGRNNNNYPICWYGFSDWSSSKYCPSSTDKCFDTDNYVSCGPTSQDCEQRCTNTGCNMPTTTLFPCTNNGLSCQTNSQCCSGNCCNGICNSTCPVTPTTLPNPTTTLPQTTTTKITTMTVLTTTTKITTTTTTLLTCVPACTSGKTCCSGKCVDLKADSANCGKCGNKCPINTCDYSSSYRRFDGTCFNSVCKTVYYSGCPVGGVTTTTKITTTTVLTTTTNAPTTTQQIVTTTTPTTILTTTTKITTTTTTLLTCVPACTSGKTCCSGKCVDLKADSANCGKCGNKCPINTCDYSSSYRRFDGTCFNSVCKTVYYSGCPVGGTTTGSFVNIINWLLKFFKR